MSSIRVGKQLLLRRIIAQDLFVNTGPGSLPKEDSELKQEQRNTGRHNSALSCLLSRPVLRCSCFYSKKVNSLPKSENSAPLNELVGMEPNTLRRQLAYTLKSPKPRKTA